MAGVAAICQRCHHEFTRAREVKHGRPSPYCPPCREARIHERRKQRYNGAGQAERRQHVPKTHRAESEPPAPDLRGFPCRCALPAPKTEGPLLICGLCAREVETYV